MSAETMEFKTEVKQLLDLMIHSLYSNREIFLRELISNASDAIDKRRVAALTEDSIEAPEDGWKIKLIADEEAGTLTIRDNGLGMSRDETVESLGTIAHSGTKAFLEMLEQKDVKEHPELIGQFGVGFYSAFMVADEVSVSSRRAGLGAEQGVQWSSSADGNFTVDDAPREDVGTDVVLTLQDDMKSFLSEWKLREVVKRYSDYVEHPVVMDVTRKGEGEDAEEETHEETLNSRTAIWLKDSTSIEEDEYKEFYRHVSHDFADPARTIHYRAEGVNEFNVLLFLPSKAPFNLFYPDFRIGPTLYVRRVQIMDHCEELVPRYLRFLRGVVDSSDLPLNVSREILQNNKQIEVIRKSVTKKVLGALRSLKADHREDYEAWHEEFGRVLKEGIHYDFERREEIAGLLLFETTQTEPGAKTTLDDYLERMESDQETIYYITGSSTDQLRSSPLLEAFEDKGIEVLLLGDEVDDLIFANLDTYGDKPLKSVLKGDVELPEEDEAKDGDDSKEKAKERYGALLELLSGELEGDVQEVRISGRLKGSPVCLVSGEDDMAPGMEQMMRQMGQEVPAATRILEVNPDHELLTLMKEQIGEEDQGLLKEYARLLLDQALLLEGNAPKDPAAFAKAMTRLMVKPLVRA
jgi:molecular chaperone HtpG